MEQRFPQILVEFLSATSFDASFDSAKAVRDAWMSRKAAEFSGGFHKWGYPKMVGL
jgi:hypothetical protein